MAQPFQAVQVSDHVYWVGVVDWSVRDFHGYLTSRGTTYNAFLILGEETLLVDTVKRPFKEEFFSRIGSVIDPAKIDYIISNHSEMDHSGSLPETLEKVKPKKVYASKNGVKALREHFNYCGPLEEVKNGCQLTLGGLRLSFFETRLLHWPDSMVTYLKEDGVLFSQDAFGMHLASSERYADQMEDGVLYHEAAKYYANILLPFSPLIQKFLKQLPELELDIQLLAPDHGPLWREDVTRPKKWYEGWASQTPTKKAVVVYDTMWESTEKMARAVSEGLLAGGASVKVDKLRVAHRSDVATDILDAGALVVGSPTLNNGLFPTLADCLCYLKGLKPKNLQTAAFGSYGWSGEAVSELERLLEEMGLETAAEALKVQYVPDGEALQNCFEWGKAIAEKLG